MNNTYRKYLITSTKDKSWGFYINNLGRNVIKKTRNIHQRIIQISIFLLGKRDVF
jgi:hypothetical protein